MWKRKHLITRARVENGSFKAVAGWFVCRCFCNTFERINKSQKGLNFNPALHISPSTEKPILLGFSPLFTLAGLHFLLLPVTAIKISSRSAIMVSSCHCVDEQGEVQHCWNVLDSERDGKGGGRIIPGPSCSLVAILWYQTNMHCFGLCQLPNRPFLRFMWFGGLDQGEKTSLSSYQKTFEMTSGENQLRIIHKIIRFISSSPNTLNLLNARGQFIIYLWIQP